MIGVVIALITILVELEDRQSERTFTAWQVVRAGAVGSSHREAVEYLNREFAGFLCEGWVNSISRLLTGNRRRECLIPKKERESLAGLQAAGADLAGADLTDADLMIADLTGANLTGADLTGADLTGATLEGATLKDATLIGAHLASANLTGADLTGADLKGAYLGGAFLTDSAPTQSQLDAACGTFPPYDVLAGLVWTARPCPE